MSYQHLSSGPSEGPSIDNVAQAHSQQHVPAARQPLHDLGSLEPPTQSRSHFSSKPDPFQSSNPDSQSIPSSSKSQSSQSPSSPSSPRNSDSDIFQFPSKPSHEHVDHDSWDSEVARLTNFVHMDNFGNSYEHVDFDARRYTDQRRFKGQKLVYFTSAFVSLFVSLFGYEQGVCSGILTFVTFQKFFHEPTATEIGLVISILEIGAMISSLMVSRVSEKLGRKRTILIGTTVFIVGGSLQSFAANLWVFGVGRVLSGFGVGVLSTMVPSYQCEISPVEERGKLVCGEFTGNIAGYFLSVWVDYFCYFIQDIGDARTNPHSFAAHLSWRLPLFVQVVLAAILLVGGFFIVESPRWLLDVDDDQRGFHVLCLLYHGDTDASRAEKEFFLIKNSILDERIKTPKHERSWRHLFRNYRLRVFIACSALAFAQFNGINIISYYAPMVFEEAGFNDSKALLMTGVNAFIYLLSTVPPWFLVDKWGRKPILISGGISMGVCLTAISFVMYLDVASTPQWVAFLVIVYNASFGYSWGPIGFLIPPEVYPLAVRSKGVSLSTAANWLANYVVGQLTPVLQESIGWVMYLFPALSCLLSVMTVIFVYPETKGVELEDIDKLFEKAPGYNQVPMELDEFDYELGK